MIGWYILAKDFAAPITTIVAASAAAYVTIAIQRQNYRVARNRLKLDLFERRYDIYTATRDLLLLLSHNPNHNDEAVSKEFRHIYAKMTEAPFVCGDRAQAFCLQVREADQNWRTAKARAATINSLPPGPEKTAAALAPPEAAARFLELQERIVPAFSEDLWIGWSDVRSRRHRHDAALASRQLQAAFLAQSPRLRLDGRSGRP